jgi:hypothetical protein
MCYENENELYNEGQPFKITARDESGVVVTVISDNYFGYSKKEIKTQISYASNLYGLSEEEHAGGAVVFPRWQLADVARGKTDKTFDDVKHILGSSIDVKEEGYAIDTKYPNIFYVPENAIFNLYEEKVTWTRDSSEHSITLLPNRHYFFPDGYRVNMEKHPEAPIWRLIGTTGNGVFCHKSSTVSGGGKSEISKSLLNAVIYGPHYVGNLEEDLKKVKEVLDYDKYSERWKNPRTTVRTKPSRDILSPERSLGSVIKLLTPSDMHTDEYRLFLSGIDTHVKPLILLLKKQVRFEYRKDNRYTLSMDDLKGIFNVNMINGHPGHELYLKERKVVASYLRVGFSKEGHWSVHRLRSDFVASFKIQLEDDITSSITIPGNFLNIAEKSVKIVENCESHLFQRPDEAINKGYDKEAESDLARKNVFITNYEPLTPEDGKKIMEDAIGFDQYTEPIQKIIRDGATGASGAYFISPSHPRIVDGKPSSNPRYLQTRHDFVHPELYYLAEIATRLFRHIPFEKKVYYNVNAVIPARNTNPPDHKKGIRALSVFSPIHYQELPELFMDLISSLTGKSPSKTGAGSEGALTKGPFIC